MQSPFSIELFTALPLIGILRGFNLRQLPGIVQAAIEGGLTNLEITMNTPDAAQQIRTAHELGRGRVNIGAGTVTSLRLRDDALAAGASFVVTPTLEADIIQRCVNDRVPIFPGAFTPTEVLHAWDLGATMVKIFPAEALGPPYIRALKGPFPRIKLLPTGGVDLATLGEYVRAGADGFGIGSPLFDRKRIDSSDWAWVQAQCRSFAEGYRRERAG